MQKKLTGPKIPVKKVTGQKIETSAEIVVSRIRENVSAFRLRNQELTAIVLGTERDHA